MKKSDKFMKIVGIDGKNFHIFSTNWGISMKFSGKICFVIILKSTKKQNVTSLVLSWRQIFGKTTRGGQIAPSQDFFGDKLSCFEIYSRIMSSILLLEVSSHHLNFFWHIFSESKCSLIQSSGISIIAIIKLKTKDSNSRFVRLLFLYKNMVFQMN